MKHGKKPTRKQKQEIAKRRLNPCNWLVVKDCMEVFQIIHRKSGTVRCYFKKEVRC